MLRCLNPKKAHENRGSFARSVPSGKTTALAVTTSTEGEESGEEQVACQYCKYLLAEAVLGDCRIIRWIGSGAFGDVYEAEQLPPLSRRVAVKVMAVERVVDGESAEMFAREVSMVAALDHPNILPVLRVGMIDDGRPYLVMKYAAQGSLQQFCQPNPSAFPTPSLTPTVIHASMALPPADQLTSATVETLDLSELIERDVASEQTRRQESAATATARAPHVTPDEENVPTVRMQMSPDDAIAQQETLQITHSIALVTSEQTQETASTGILTAEPAADQTKEATLLPLSALAVASDGDIPHVEPDLADETATRENRDEPAPDLQNDASEASTPRHEQAPEAADASTTDDEQTAEIADAAAQIPEIPQTLTMVNEQPDLENENAACKIPAVPLLEEMPTEDQNATSRAVAQIATVLLAGDAPLTVAPSAPLAVPGAGAGPLSLQQVLVYVEEAASALSYAHQRGLIHLDVKPANLLLDAQGRLLLADFGVSVLLEGYTHASLHYYVGTPLYTAPEQWLEQPRTASDQYALAVTCYQLLTGRPPFTGNLYAVMHGHLQVTPPPMYEFNPLIPVQIEAVIRRALAKDPLDRYPDILAFARAFREALENAASADTDTQMQQRVNFLLEAHPPASPPQAKPSVASDPSDDLMNVTPSAKKAPPEPGTFREHLTGKRVSRNRSHAGRLLWPRTLLLGVLAVLLIFGGSLGFVRAERPCWLGVCPQILLSTNAITLTNNELQPIEITNTGTDTLHWTAAPNLSASWLTLSTRRGDLAPGKSGKLIIQTDVDHLNLDPSRVYTYTDAITISGGPGVAAQTLRVTENIVKGLSAVSVNTSGQNFLYEQNRLQPGKQTITITNQSGQTLNWFTQDTDNNWLAVTPSQGSLKNKQSIKLTVTVVNPQDLANDIYQVHFSLIGQLDNQTDFTLLQTINFSLQVNQTAQAQPTVSTSPTAPPTPLSFTARQIAASGAPTTQRFNHSMVWDAQDDQLLIFGGSDAKGNLLNDLWSYSPATNRWSNLTPANASANASDCSGGSPAPRMSAAMVWDSTHQQILLYGGLGSNKSFLEDLWAFSPAKGTWSVLACTGNDPGARGEAGVAWNGSQMLLLGGLGPNGPQADFWAYTPGSDGGWNQIAASTPLGARTYPAMSWDSTAKQLYVFGGLGANGQPLGDFHSYQPASGWNTIEPGNSSTPLARQQALSTWDSKDGVFLLMGGWQASSNTTYSTLWAYSPTENVWWQISSLHTGNSVIPGRMASVMLWDSTDNRAYIYAGSTGKDKAALNDLWTIAPG